MNKKLFLTIVAALVCAYLVIRVLHEFIDGLIVAIKSDEQREIGFAAIMKSSDAVPAGTAT